MGKRKGEWLSFIALLLVFMLTTLFFYMVYTMHPMILPDLPCSTIKVNLAHR